MSRVKGAASVIAGACLAGILACATMSAWPGVMLASSNLWSRAHDFPSDSDCRAANQKYTAADRNAPLVRMKLVFMDPATGKPQEQIGRAHSLEDEQRLRTQSKSRDAVCLAAMSHSLQFVDVYYRAVELLCPALGFALFWLLASGTRPRNLWKPLALLLIAILIPRLLWGTAAPSAQIAQSLVVTLAMMAV